MTQVDDNVLKNGVDSGAPDTRTTNSYAWYDAAVQSGSTYKPDITQSTTYTTTYSLNPTGVATSVSIADGRPRTVTLTNSMDGQAIRRDESDNNASLGDPHDVWYRFNGVELGHIGNNDTTELDYTGSLLKRDMPVTTVGPFRYGASAMTEDYSFSNAPEAINSFQQGSTGGSYVVQGGESLQSIAQNLWGDSSLWYKIAEANGLGANSQLIQGQSLVLPAGVERSHNNASNGPADPPGQERAPLIIGLMAAILLR